MKQFGSVDAFIMLFDSSYNLVYSTYFGGSQWDEVFRGIAIDSSNNVYVSGLTGSLNFPTVNAHQSVKSANEDAFISRFNSSGQPVFSTLLGGDGFDHAYDIAIDSSSNVYVTGFTSSLNFPTLNPIQASRRGDHDGFISKYNSSGQLVYSTYIGGSDKDVPLSICVDSTGAMYVGGRTNSPSDGIFIGGTIPGLITSLARDYDGFVTKLNSAGSSILYSTYFGGSQSDRIDAIAVDSSNTIYIGGHTSSSHDGIFVGGSIPGLYKTFNGGTWDGIVAKLSIASGVNNPSSPSNLQGQRIGLSTIRVTWQASSQGTHPIAGYRIYRSQTPNYGNAVQIASVSNSTLEFNDTNTNIKEDYYYWIVAFDNASPSNSSSPSAMLNMESSFVRPHPVTISATRVDENHIRVEWNKPLEGTFPIKEYCIVISEDGEETGTTESVSDPNQQEYSILVLNSSDSLITVWVIAIDEQGFESEKSNEVHLNVLPTLFVHGWQALKTDTRYDETKIWTPMIVNIVNESIIPPQALVTENQVYNQLNNNLIEVESPYNFESPHDTSNKRYWNIYRYEYKTSDDSSPLGVFYVSNYNCNKIENRPYEGGPPNPTDEHILLYSLHLKYEIEKIKSLENVEKVNIVAHSMGGLVARGLIEFQDFLNTEYFNGYPDDNVRLKFNKSKRIQYGTRFIAYFKEMYPNDEPPVDKLIMLGTPNHGAMNRFIYNRIKDSFVQGGHFPVSLNNPNKLNPFAGVGYYSRATFDMDPSSHFLNILNFHMDDYDNYDHLVDKVHSKVKYATVSGQFPGAEIRFLMVYWYLKGGNNNIFEKLIPTRRELDSADNIDDGFIHADSTMIDHSIHYPVLFADHSNLIKRKPFSNLVYDILFSNKDTFNFNRYWSLDAQFYSDYQFFAKLTSPVDLLVTDNEGRKTGILDDGFVSEIPDSFISVMDQGVVIISDNKEDFRGLKFDVTGHDYLTEEKGMYGFYLSMDSYNSNNIQSMTNTPPSTLNSETVYFATNQGTQANQLDTYQLDWTNLFNQKPYNMTIMKDLNGDGFYDEIIQTSFSPQTLAGGVDKGVVNLVWEPPLEGSNPIDTYRVFRSTDGGQQFIFLGESSGTSFSDGTGKIGETYSYFVVAVDNLFNFSPPSNIATFGPLKQTPYPHLRIWAELNKPSFSEDETAMVMVTVANQGGLVASNTRVKMTLPQELSFLRASRYRSVVLTQAIIEFELGAIPPNSIQTFQVDVKVNVAVSQIRSIPIHFDVTCTEKTSDFTHVLLQLVPQRSGRADLYLGLYYRNAHWDPQTSSVFIPQDTPLEIDLILTGAQAPYELSIDWGDSETEVLSQQKDLHQTLRHQFKTKGKMTIIVKVTDQLQRSKTATLTMEVR